MAKINIDDIQIISSSELTRNYKEVSKKINKDGINFIFKNNKPDKVIMTYKKYEDLIELLEHVNIYLTVKRFDKADTGKRYNIDDIIHISTDQLP